MLIKFYLIEIIVINSERERERERERKRERAERERASEWESNSIRNVHYFCFNVIMFKYNSSLMKSLFVREILGMSYIGYQISYMVAFAMRKH